MRLRSFHLTDSMDCRGLSTTTLRGLGSTVALVGPNGAGKSRLLDIVHNALGDDCSIKDHDSIEDQIANATNSFLNDVESLPADSRAIWERAIADARQIGPVNAPVPEGVKPIRNSHNTLVGMRNSARRLRNDYSVLPRRGVRPILLRTEIKSYADPGSVTIERLNIAPLHIMRDIQFRSGADRGDAVGLLFHQVAYALYNMEHPRVAKQVADEWHHLYIAIKQMISNIMKMDFSYTVQGMRPLPTLDGRPVIAGELSNGQRIILGQIAGLIGDLVQIVAGESQPSLRGCVILVDEPETHLHPSAVSQFIEALQKCVGKEGQIWVATHSVPLVADIGIDSVWAIENGTVYPPGVSQHARAVRLLLGEQTRADKLLEFMESPATMAANRFAAQCVLPPVVVDFREGDPQLHVISSQMVGPRLEMTRILDIGAGQGRLLRALADQEHGSWSYTAVEPNNVYRNVIMGIAKERHHAVKVYESVMGRDIQREVPFDLAVLCNVLHEIRPAEWIPTIQAIRSITSSSGKLLVCEDLEMPAGECPHELGFLILNANELSVLFQQEADILRHDEPRYADRLMFARFDIDRVCVTKQSVSEALSCMRARAKCAIRELRSEGNKTPQMGRKYALLSQLVLNAEFALEDLEKNKQSATAGNARH